jgi:phenylpyruvate tautomerase PptA (4-oxalocrotonate tautomerase family)
MTYQVLLTISVEDGSQADSIVGAQDIVEKAFNAQELASIGVYIEEVDSSSYGQTKETLNRSPAIS